MSNEIQPGNIPANIANSTSQTGEAKTKDQSGSTSVGSVQSPSKSDQVSMTDDASRLKEVEGMVKNMPAVNSALVAAISQQINDGSLEIDLDSTASQILASEAGIADPNS